MPDRYVAGQARCGQFRGMKRLLLAVAVFALTTAPGFAGTTCYVAEFSIGASAGTQVAAQPLIAEQTVTIGGSSTQSSAFNGNTRLIRLHCDGIASFKIATNPTATTSTARIAADQTEYFQVNPGDKIAVISNN